MEFKWFRNGKELTKGQNVDIRSYSDLSTLVIDPLTEEDTGNYTCTANVRSMMASYTATLEVLGKHPSMKIIKLNYTFVKLLT